MSLLVAAADEPASVDAASVAATVLAGAELAGAAELAGVDALAGLFLCSVVMYHLTLFALIRQCP